MSLSYILDFVQSRRSHSSSYLHVGGCRRGADEYWDSNFASGSTEVLSEANLCPLYGVDMKLIAFCIKGKIHEALVPILR